MTTNESAAATSDRSAVPGESATTSDDGAGFGVVSAALGLLGFAGARRVRGGADEDER